MCVYVCVYEGGQPSCSSWSSHSVTFVCSGVYWEKKDRINRSLGACWMQCVCLPWGRNTAPCLSTKCAWVHQYKAVCFVFKAELCVTACLLSSCSFNIETQICVCMCVCMKEGSQVAASDLLTQLHLYAQKCTERRKTAQNGAQEHAGCCVCVPSFRMKYSPMPYNHKCMSASIQGCVFCTQGRAVGCSLLAKLLN